MAFTWHGRRVFWRGIGSPRDDIFEPSLQALATDPERPLLDVLLQQYDDIFAEPRGLPLSRPLRPQDPPPTGHGSSGGPPVPLPPAAEGRA